MGDLHATRCAICGTLDNAVQLYSGSFDERALSPAVFSARRLPDRVHYRMVKCRDCGLVRSDPVADVAVLRQLYRQSSVTYGEETANIRHTYGRYLARLDAYGVRKDALLEIGCGNGFFLEEALGRGYHSVFGVEPSRAAVDGASPAVRARIECDTMQPGLFSAGQFDVICMFQVLDHVPEPARLLHECCRILRPGGMVLCLNHNVEAVSARLLRERSPIVDIEHTYLYSARTLRRLFGASGFVVHRCGTAFNRYSIRYLFRLIPLPGALKAWMATRSAASRLGRVSLTLPLGNIYLVAEKVAG